MSKPNILSPWFVVMLLKHDMDDSVYDKPQWYTAPLDGVDNLFSEDRTQAMLFPSIHSAHRVARAAGGYVVAVCDEEDWKEYRDER